MFCMLNLVFLAVLFAFNFFVRDFETLLYDFAWHFNCCYVRLTYYNAAGCTGRSPGFVLFRNTWIQRKHPDLNFMYTIFFLRGIFLDFLVFIYNCVICRPSASTVSEDAVIEPRTVATTALERLIAMALQCRSHNCTGLNSSILRHSWIWGAAEEAVLNKLLKNPKKPLIFFLFPYFQQTQKREFSCLILWNFKTKSDDTLFLKKVKT